MEQSTEKIGTNPRSASFVSLTQLHESANLVTGPVLREENEEQWVSPCGFIIR